MKFVAVVTLILTDDFDIGNLAQIFWRCNCVQNWSFWAKAFKN